MQLKKQRKMGKRLSYTLLFLMMLLLSESIIAQSLLDAIKENDLKKVQALVNTRNINEVDENGATPLMWAAYKGDLKMVELLVEKGADFSKKGLIYLNDSTYYGNLLGIAASEDKLELLKYLIEECKIDLNDLECNPDIENLDGWTALQWANKMGNDEIINYLKKLGAIDPGQMMLYYEAGEIEKAALEGEALIPFWVKIYKQRDTLYFAEKLNFVANLFVKAKNYQKAETYFLQAKAVFDSAQAETEPNIAAMFDLYLKIVKDLANLYEALNQNEEALQLYLNALEKTEKTLGKNHSSYGTNLNYLVELYFKMGQYDEALPLCLEAIQNTKQTLGKEHSYYGIRLNNLAAIYYETGQYDKSLPLFIEALENTEKSLGKEHSYYGTRLNNLATLYRDMGQYDKALPFYLEALRNAEKSFGNEHPFYGTTLNNIANIYKKTNQYNRALPLYHEALEITEKTLGRNHSDYGIRLNNLAAVYYEMGQYDKALPLLIEALENTKKSLGKEHSFYGIRLNNLAQLYNTIGRNDKALALSLEAIENIEKTLGKEHISFIKTLNEIALIYFNLGLYNEALSFFLDALESIEITLGKDHSYYAITLNNLAGFYDNFDEYDLALPLYLEAIENTERIYGKEHSDYGIRLNNLAGLYQNMNQYDKSLPLYMEALKNAEKFYGKESSFYGNILNNMAGLYRDLGQYDNALSLYLEAIDKTKISTDKKHHFYINILNNLSHLYYTIGQYDKAMELYQEAQQLQINLLKSNFSFLSESEQEKNALTLKANFLAYQSFYLRYFPQNKEVGASAYNLELSVKGMILQSGIQMRQAFLTSADSVGRKQFEEWLSLRQQINFLLNKPVSERYASVDSLEDIANKLERSLMQQSQEFAKMQSVFDVSWKDVQQGLKDNEVAIELISFRNFNGTRWTDSTYYAALVVRKTDTVPQMLFLFEEADIIELLPGTDAGPSSYDLAYKGSRASGVAFFDQTTYHGDALYKLIWQPIDSLLQGVEKVYFSPSGLLHRISMAALPHPETGLLMDHYQLVQLSSTRQLAEPPKEYKLKDAVVFGGIDYELPESMLASLTTNNTGLPSTANYAQLRSFVRQYSGFSYLQGSMEEATVVSRQLSNQISTTTYTKHDATEEKFMALSDKTSPSVIHIATHGFYFPDTISERQRDEMMLTALGEDRFRVTDDPLMRSALVMAGANYAWAGNTLPAGIEDGILTAKEVSSMNLSNTKLVVLSACQTGLGDVNGSEGITGLQRAFKMAGVECLIMSLWSIPDKETREFMEVFYGQWPAHPDINLAFTETQKQMRNKYPQEPYKWAGFVLVE